MNAALAALAGLIAGVLLGFTLHAAFVDLPPAQIAAIAANAALAARSTAAPPPPCSPASAPVQGGAAAAHAAASVHVDELTADQQRARDEKTQLIDAALERGRWTEADASAGRRLLPRLTPSDQRELMSRVAVAINDGKLKVEARRPF